ncbi:MAG TPA: RseA family anti-sigma factor [Pseudomonadales bacterium]|nr:RseA family anti-sigma factor [Pseudomonadales bacterium]HND13648.1 RseA family anti-sigma factor [Pseudomonadales bacterium]
MNEPLREMVSAVVDGEASEFELRRVLDGCEDAEVGALLARHFAVRSVLRGETTELCPPQVSRSILAALEAEAPLGAAPAPVARWRIPLGGAAVAASVCLVAVFGLRALAPSSDGKAVEAPALAASDAQPLAPLGAPAAVMSTLPSAAVPVGFGPAVRVAPGAAQAVSADRLAEDRLRLYMGEHVRNAAFNANQGMLPYARVVSDESR